MCLRQRNNIANIGHFITFIIVASLLHALVVECNFLGLPVEMPSIMMSAGFILGTVAWESARSVKKFIYTY